MLMQVSYLAWLFGVIVFRLIIQLRVLKHLGGRYRKEHLVRCEVRYIERITGYGTPVLGFDYLPGLVVALAGDIEPVITFKGELNTPLLHDVIKGKHIPGWQSGTQANPVESLKG